MSDTGPGARLDDDTVAAALAEPGVWVEPDAALAERVVAAVAAVSADAPVRAGSGRRRRWTAAALAAIAGAAAATIVAVAVWPAEDGRPTADAPPIAMTGSELAPEGDGTAGVRQLESGWAIDLAIPGLARLEDGEFYQVWLSDCGGQYAVPAGSFHDLRRAVAWAGVSPVEYPRLWVTREALAWGDDGQEPSADVVSSGLSGTCP